MTRPFSILFCVVLLNSCAKQQYCKIEVPVLSGQCRKDLSRLIAVTVAPLGNCPSVKLELVNENSSN